MLEGSLLQDGAKPGDVLKAEADFELEGITIVSVVAPKTDGRSEPQRIEVVGPGRPEAPGVTTQLVGRSERRPSDHRRDRDDGRPRRDRDAGRPPTGRDTGRPRREVSGSRPESTPGRSDSRDRPGGSSDDRRDRPSRPARQDAPSGRDSSPGRGRRNERPGGPAEHSDADSDRPKARRLNPGNAHRKAVMESLPPEQQPIAEQVLRGGIPAVRTALHLEREKAAAEGRAAPNTDELIAMAEAVLPKLKAAEWRDRAEAAAANADDISLRDLRSVVAGADSARDEETRTLAVSVREALERRVAALHGEWSKEIGKNLDENRVVRALRLSARPPDPGARLDGDLSKRLTEAAGQAMSPDAAPDRWAAILDAVVVSPIRRLVQPLGLPSDAPPDLKRTAHQHSGSVPALAKLLGVSITPPPLPSGPRRRPEPPSGSGRRPRPPRPRSQSAAPEAPSVEAGGSEPLAAEPVASAPPAEPSVSEVPAAEAGPDVPPAQPVASTPPAEQAESAPLSVEPTAPLSPPEPVASAVDDPGEPTPEAGEPYQPGAGALS